MNNKLKLVLLGTILAATLPMAAQAQQWGGDHDRRGGPQDGQDQFWNRHPGYLQALSDLRTAYALMQHRQDGDPVQADELNRAANETLAAYNELQQAAINDGRDINAQPPADFTWGDHRGRLKQANELLYRASHEIRSEEENPAARGMRDRAVYHIGEASRWVGQAQRFWHY